MQLSSDRFFHQTNTAVHVWHYRAHEWKLCGCMLLGTGVGVWECRILIGILDSMMLYLLCAFGMCVLLLCGWCVLGCSHVASSNGVCVDCIVISRELCVGMPCVALTLCDASRLKFECSKSYRWCTIAVCHHAAISSCTYRLQAHDAIRVAVSSHHLL